MSSASVFWALVAVLLAATSHTPCDVHARTQIKWLINTADLASHWPPAVIQTDSSDGSKCNRCMSAMPNTVTRLQMIRGGTTAVLVMPTGDGGRRCCSSMPQFSLGFVDLKHGTNNLYPTIHPFPDWRAFVDTTRQSRRPDRAESYAAEFVREEDFSPAEDRPNIPDDETFTNQCNDDDTGTDNESQYRQHRIVNAVDAFMDDRGRLLWVLDTGNFGQETCNGNTQSGGDRTSSDSAELNDSLLPKFFAIDVYTNQTISVVSLSRVWRPGVSCFQYIVALYPESGISNEFNNKIGDSCTKWPLIVIGDAGTNRLLVYLYCKDKFTEIVLPVQEHSSDGSVQSTTSNETSRQRYRRCKWPTPPIRDILYLVPLYPQQNNSRLLITYHGCRNIYKLWLQVSLYSCSSTDETITPVTGTLTLLGRKPCRMVILGTDRRRTDVGGVFAGGGTTVYFRLENTNDIWSWDVSAIKNNDCGSSAVCIDERDFRLVRVGKTCRVPVAVSAAAVVAAAATAAGNSNDVDAAAGKCHRPNGATAANQVQQLVWMLETNFVDHFAGTSDRMGVNAKLQPIETPLFDDEVSSNASKEPAKPRLRVQPNSPDDGQTPRTSICRKFSAPSRMT